MKEDKLIGGSIQENQRSTQGIRQRDRTQNDRKQDE